MRTTFYAIITKKGLDRTCKTDPTNNLRMGEYAVKVHLDIPDEVFRTPIPTATITVPDLVGNTEAPIVTLQDVCDGDFDAIYEDDVDSAVGQIVSHYECSVCGAESGDPQPGPHFTPGAF